MDEAEDIHMRKLPAIIVAMGFLSSTSPIPIYATPPTDAAKSTNLYSQMGGSSERKHKGKKKGAEIIPLPYSIAA